MPNHIVNVLTINTNPDRLKEIRELMADEEDLISFDRILPMPESLDLTDGSEAHVARYPEDFAGYKDRSHFNMAVYNQCLENIRLHGHPTWYGWSTEHWGTKWNAYQIVERAPNVIEFQTAWSTPLPVFKTLASRFPDVEFVVEFADEDFGSNQGTLLFRDGCLAGRIEIPGDHRSRERQEFAMQLHGYSPEGIEEYFREVEEERRARGK